MEAQAGVQVSEFDDSVDNHLKAVASISRICGGRSEISQYDDASEIQRVASSVTFLRQWRDFAYERRIVNFSPDNETGYGTNVINLPQYSSAAVPKDTRTALQASNTSNSSKDFILYCGGPIWGLDWCPQVRQDPGGNFNCEFLAVAAHPPGSSYNKLGAPLFGRGVIQIWCFVNAVPNDSMEELSMVKFHAKNLRGRPKKKQEIDDGSEDTLPKQPRGRPRKELAEKSSDQKLLKKRGRPTKKKALVIHNDNGNQALVPYSMEQSAQPIASNEVVPEQLSDQKPSEQSQPVALTEKSSDRELPKKRGRPRKKQAMVIHNDDGNQAVITYSMEQSAQPIASTEVVPEQSTSAKSGEMMLATSCSSDLISVDDIAPIRAINFSDDDTEVSLLLKRVRDRSTQPVKAYVRRHRLANTARCKQFFNSCASIPEQSRTRVDDKDYFKRVDLETNVQGTRVRQQKHVSEKFPAISSALHYEEEYHLLSARTELTGEDDVNAGSCTVDAEYPTTANADIGPFPLCNTPSGEEVVTLSTDIIIPQDIALPRLALCLAHNGKVAWDVKWRPIADVSHCKLRMGYLAVLLGNGSLEVWDVPLPSAVCDVFSYSRTGGTDPRFIKLKPVFKCSQLMFKGRQSIPLTVEWSAYFPCDLLLAGCHDGTVAVWKFAEGNPCEDTRPLLCFRADTTTIRAVSWAPAENDGEDAQVIVTAGHNGLKFWDMRDPFYPLWTHSSLRIYSVDWMPKPRCVVISSDDGSLKLLGISEVSNDVSVTGKPFSGTKLQGLHTFNCSSYAIWSVHISRVTGMAAYCSADGTVVRFQLTTKAVEKDHSRHRVPHFLFGSLTGNDSVVTVNTPPSNTPTQLNKTHAGPQSMRALVDLYNQSRMNYLQLKESTAEDQTLAVWDGNDLGQDPIASAGPTSMIEDGESQLAMVCQVVGAKSATIPENPTKTATKPSGPPHKILAIHRVRWNTNKGSERWLCSGGAAGIVRCQEMVFTDVDKMYFRDK